MAYLFLDVASALRLREGLESEIHTETLGSQEVKSGDSQHSQTSSIMSPLWSQTTLHQASVPLRNLSIVSAETQGLVLWIQPGLGAFHIILYLNLRHSI